MVRRDGLVGRQAERERLGRALERSRGGDGSILLLSGEAGIGKTYLAEDLASRSTAVVLSGRASRGAATPYGPIVAALRSYLRAGQDGLDGCGPLRPHLALILPELGTPAQTSDRATLFEAVRCAFAHIAGEGHALLLLDDLQWSDDGTLELLEALAEPLGELPVLVVGAYRSDGLPRDHPLRRLRHELRRGGRLDEVALAPLSSPETADLLARVLDGTPAPSLTGEIQERTKGVPFFVKEFARALVATGALTAGPEGLELSPGAEVPLPETIREAVLLAISELSADARAAAEAAAVAGEAFDLDVVGEVSSAAGLAELSERGLIAEDGSGRAAFHHALTREALYSAVAWLRRRVLHRGLAEALERAGRSGMEVAFQWLDAGDERRARDALVRAAAESRSVHAHRDAARAGRRALALWPRGEEDERRIEVLEGYATSAELSGEPVEAVRGWLEICAFRADRGDRERLADAQRRMAAVYDLTGDCESAAAVRGAAAEAYAAIGRPTDAAAERLAVADYLSVSANHSAAIELARAAGAEAAERTDLRARALGIEGVARARRGEFEEGLEAVQTGLALALQHGLTAVSAELYQRLSVVLYSSGDYRRAEETLDTALGLCRAAGEPAIELVCVGCMIYVLRECGDWSGATVLGRELIANGTEAWFGEGMVGAIRGFQGRFGSGRRLLSSSLVTSSQIGYYNMIVDSTAALAWVAAAEGADGEATSLYRSLLARWESSEDHHYAISGLRRGAGFFARRGDLEAATTCAGALTRIASDTGHPDALAALAHAIAETALAGGDTRTAAEQLSRAVELHRGLDIPFERAEIELRAGVALAASGERVLALERLGDAYRAARKLGARPLAAEAAGEVAALGESVLGRLGRRAAADAAGAGLSRRELEVVRLLASGRTNREIAEDLFLSPRTVDMHVRNLLRKLDSRSRVEAARRAGELGLLAPGP